MQLSELVAAVLIRDELFLDLLQLVALGGESRRESLIEHVLLLSDLLLQFCLLSHECIQLILLRLDLLLQLLLLCFEGGIISTDLAVDVEQLPQLHIVYYLANVIVTEHLLLLVIANVNHRHVTHSLLVLLHDVLANFVEEHIPLLELAVAHATAVLDQLAKAATLNNVD